MVIILILYSQSLKCRLHIASYVPAVVSEILLYPCPSVTVSRMPKCRALQFQVCIYIPFFIESMYSSASKAGGNQKTHKM